MNKLRGVDALPIAVTLCDAMISLVDDAYYSRAWCGVEVLLIDALEESYGVHHRFEHVETPSGGHLRGISSKQKLAIDELRLTNEIEDRPKIDFLVRQSKLLGRDLA